MREIRHIQISTPSMGDEEWLATKECFDTGWLTTGKKVAAFEDKFAELHKVQHAIATTSCTTALHLILAAMDIGPGDEVLVPAFTGCQQLMLYCMWVQHRYSSTWTLQRTI